MTVPVSYRVPNTLSKSKCIYSIILYSASFNFQSYYGLHNTVASKPGGPGGTGPPTFCHAVSNENNMKNIEITNGLIFKKHVAFLTSRFPMILCP